MLPERLVTGISFKRSHILESRSLRKVASRESGVASRESGVLKSWSLGVLESGGGCRESESLSQCRTPDARLQTPDLQVEWRLGKRYPLNVHRRVADLPA